MGMAQSAVSPPVLRPMKCRTYARRYWGMTSKISCEFEETESAAIGRE